MKITIVLTFIFSANIYAHKERECGCTSSKIWLDVILLVDHSNNVNQDQLAAVQKHILETFGQTTISSSANHSIRIGLAAFAKNVVSLADLSKITSQKALETAVYKISRNVINSEVNTAMALNWAGSNFMLYDKRPNAKNVIVLYSSAYSQGNVQDPSSVANQIKNSGVTIITVAINGVAWPLLSLLASPDDGLSLTGSDINHDVLRSFCKANCFCKSGFTQLVDSSGNKYGECLATTNNINNWLSASTDCSQWYKGAYLASEFSSFKHSFLMGLTKAQNIDSYYIGLHYDKNESTYLWQQESGRGLALDTSFLPWNLNYPNTSYGNCVKVSHSSDSKIQNMGWTNSACVSQVSNYVCQMNTCDSDHYCATLDDYE